ncbi:hypothetical protein WQQ_11050 [Hydrocarboniphaga effusa AP103]|uniref:Uncharacterized protein n=1 Tax=Hydrocarboniphaga effusa AP103 TaxID=1172194 RepID=I8TBQ0_9GAMM|nr:hypothetical protein WQQ_11050 [Hydrocarboniphaga effusa AP103]
MSTACAVAAGRSGGSGARRVHAHVGRQALAGLHTVCVGSGGRTIRSLGSATSESTYRRRRRWDD